MNKAINEIWPFEDLKNTAVITSKQIIKNGQPILYVSHDHDDGSWQFHDGNLVCEDDAMIVGLEKIVKLDPSIKQLADLPYGWCATRKSINDSWIRQQCSE